MNRLFLNRVYLVGPMDYVADGGVGWRQRIQRDLADLRLIFFDPTNKPTTFVKEDSVTRQRMIDLKVAGDWENLKKEVQPIRQYDLSMTTISDFIIAHIDLEAYSTGTWNEIFIADNQRKPILIHVEQGKSMAPSWLFATVPHEMIFSTWEELHQYARHVAHDPEIETFGRWRFFNMGELYGYTKIPISRGMKVQVSPEDYEYLVKFSWQASHTKDGFKATRKVKHQTIAMHREVGQRAGLDMTQRIGHRDDNWLNNQRENLFTY